MRQKLLLILSFLIVGYILMPSASFAQFTPGELFQFALRWQEPVNESSYRFNFDYEGEINQRDLFQMMKRARGENVAITLPGDVTMEMALIPAGSFMMGSTEIWAYFNEVPVHQVTIEKDFYLGTTEVTQAQWEAVMGENPAKNYGVGPRYPVYYVSWEDCQEFITLLNQMGVGTYRLPSEAEWEYACAAGTRTQFFFGDSLGCETGCEDCLAGQMPGDRTNYMWYCANNSPFGPKKVAQLLPNAFGLYDMPGNLREWCLDDWHEDYTGAPVDGSAWMIPDSTEELKICRGGHYNAAARVCRTTIRSYDGINYNNSMIGLRIVREVE